MQVKAFEYLRQRLLNNWPEFSQSIARFPVDPHEAQTGRS
jgi:hypothetical protein